ncbi:MAG: MBL fold metallo-hydrolase [Burkholderiaceae bacterium]
MDPRAFVEPLGDGLYCIDTGFHRPRFDAAYLLVDHGRAAFIDTGTNFALPRLLAALTHVGLAPADVDWVIPTHVHLDHAGGAGALMRALPHARMAVHERGAPHMIDPGVLEAAATMIYGEEEMARSYGELVPVDEQRVVTTSEGFALEVGQRRIEFIDAPGHARHHHGVWDAASRRWFTGDNFGLSYDELTNANGRFVLPSTTPVQFEPEALKATVGRMLEREPAAMCLTHFGLVRDVPRLSRMLLEQIDEMAALGHAHRDAADRQPVLEAGLADLYRRRLVAHGFTGDVDAKIELLALDIQLNAEGLVAWLDRERRKRA